MAELHTSPCPACEGGKIEYAIGHPMDPYSGSFFSECYLCFGSGEIAYYGWDCEACDNQRALAPKGYHEPGTQGHEYGRCDYCSAESGLHDADLVLPCAGQKEHA